MKRSEALRLVQSLLSPHGLGRTTSDELLARLEGPLSIDYDPEEEPLPERLEFQDYGDEWYIADADPSSQRFAGGANVSSLRLSRNLTRGEKKRRAAEAVRRWNAWPELQRIVQLWYDRGDRATAQALADLLDGGKESA